MMMVIGGGIVMLGLFVLFGHLWGETVPAMALAAKLFIPAWMIMAIANMSVGVIRAGYPVRDELPILFVVFAVPAVIAGVVIWRLAR